MNIQLKHNVFNKFLKSQFIIKYNSVIFAIAFEWENKYQFYILFQ